VKILFPLILCLFPGMFVVIIGPGIIRIAQSLFGH
jgi:tight adherence protein C